MLDNTKKVVLKLDNGLTCLILPTDSTLTEISINIAYGYANEQPKEVELAHYTEHLFARFLSKKYSNRQALQNELRSRGAVSNASVDLYETRYFIKGLYDDIEFYMDILSNAMKELKIEKDIMKQEKNAVSQELRIQMSDSEWKFDQKIWNFMYKKYGYQMDTNEHIKSLKNYDITRIQNFVRKNYLLQNTTIIVNCPLNSIEKTKELLIQYFSIPNKCPNCFVTTPVFSYKHKKLQIVHIPNKVQNDSILVRQYVSKNIKYMSDEHISLLYIQDILFNFEKGIFFKKLRDEYGLIYSMSLNLDIDMKNSKSSLYYLETSVRDDKMETLIYHLLEIISKIEVSKTNIENTRRRFKLEKEMQKFNNLTTFNKFYGKYFMNKTPIIERSDIYDKMLNIPQDIIQKYVEIFKKDMLKGNLFYYSKYSFNKQIKQKIGDNYDFLSI
jgi:predicted Zn-dependent peptidase